METGSKIEILKRELKSKIKFSWPIHHRTPKESFLQTIVIFLLFFLLINYYYVRPKTSVTKNFLTIMSKGNTSDISKLATDCNLYKNNKVNEAIKNEYLNQLSYIIQMNNSDKTNNFYIKLIDDSSFSFDINISNTNYGTLTKNLVFVKDGGTYKLDTNSYIKKVCNNKTNKKTELENKLLMRQLLYCYQYYLDDYINNGNTTVFSFIAKNSILYKYVSDFKKNNLDFSQKTVSLEFKDTYLKNNSANIKVYETIKQDKEKIISLKKRNYSYQAINLNQHWLLCDFSLKN